MTQAQKKTNEHWAGMAKVDDTLIKRQEESSAPFLANMFSNIASSISQYTAHCLCQEISVK